MTILNVKAIEVLSIIRHSFCEVTDSMSTNYKNDIWTEITNPWWLGSQNCYCVTSSNVQNGIKPDFFSYFSIIDRIFLNDRKKLSHKVWKYRLVNTVEWR